MAARWQVSPLHFQAFERLSELHSVHQCDELLEIQRKATKPALPTVSPFVRQLHSMPTGDVVSWDSWLQQSQSLTELFRWNDAPWHCELQLDTSTENVSQYLRWCSPMRDSDYYMQSRTVEARSEQLGFIPVHTTSDHFELPAAASGMRLIEHVLQGFLKDKPEIVAELLSTYKLSLSQVEPDSDMVCATGRLLPRCAMVAARY
jgi:hypothetical protein